ncbi:CLIP domain-containing serine protease B4-like [Armigeres subalbatus]|uniref:CLIP domain-containing serine protease B4-like n=1 Tax=Armigeres subalbatus TaxID=124917 RepID=UPI002ED5E327
MLQNREVFRSFILLGLAFSGYSLDENDDCINPAGQSGRCINFRNCKSVMEIYSKAVVSPDESQFIEESRCGLSTEKGTLVCCVDSSIKSTLPKPPDCGADMSNRIFGGQKTALDEFPWTALINYRFANGSTAFHCGASLINSRYVVTAAHCVEDHTSALKVVGVRLGEWDLDQQIDCDEDDEDTCANAPQDMDIEKIVVHEDYDPADTSSHNDIALIRFTEDVQMSAFVSPVCLPMDGALRTLNIVGSRGYAAGWGRTETNKRSSIKLKVQLEVTDPRTCANVYRPTGITLRDTQICAGGVRGQDTCSGDSGGPLSKLNQASYYLYGIVSFGSSKCGVKGMPGIYTAVSKYIEWIERNLE